MDKRLLAITAALMALASVALGVGTPYIVNPGNWTVTNLSWTFTTSNTNELYAAGAGTATANGKYTLKQLTSVGWIYTNANGIFLVKDTSGAGVEGPLIISTVTNVNNSSELYFNFGGDFQTGWQVNVGAPAAPTLSYGTNTVATNAIVNYQVFGTTKTWYANSNLSGVLIAAKSGDTIVVAPGVYNENNLLKDGVDWKFVPGAKVSYSGFDPNLWKLAGPGYGIFDDRGHGSVRCVIEGGEFEYRTSAINDQGLLVITNANSHVVLKGVSRIDSSGFTQMYVQRCDFVDVDVKEIKDSGGSFLLIDSNDGSGTFGQVITVKGTPIGILWEEGDMHVRCDLLEATNLYGIWPTRHASGSFSKESSLYFTGNQVHGYYYTDANDPLSRVWLTVQFLTVTNVPNNNNTAVNCTGGKTYLNAQKIYGTIGIEMAQDAILWANIEKVSVLKTWVRTFTSPGVTNFLYANILQLEDAAGPSGVVGLSGFPGIDCTTVNGTSSNSVVFLSGLSAQCKGMFLGHDRGNVSIQGYTVDNSTGTNPPVFVGGSGLRLQNMILRSPVATNSISASSAQTVQVVASAANTTNNANVTRLPAGGFLIDSGVK